MSLSLEIIEQRKTGIGGSDASTVVGLNPYMTPLQLYLQKTGQEHFIVDSPAIEWGNRLEPIVRQKYSEETGREVYVPDGLLRHPDHTFMLANLDGWTEDERLVEIKTAGRADGWGEPYSEEIPQNYLLQTQHYLCITGFLVADVAVLIGGQDFRLYEIPANKDLQELLIQAEKRFWERVQNFNPPEPVNADDLKLLYKISNGQAIEATAEIKEKVAALKALKADIKAMEDSKDELELEIKSFLKGNESLIAGTSTLVTWKSTKPGTRFDANTLKATFPDIYSQFVEITPPQRRFLVK